MKRLSLLFVAILLVGCSTRESIPLSMEDEKAVENYLSETVMFRSNDGTVESTFKVLGSDKSRGEIYLWAHMNEYYEDGNDRFQGGGWSLPVVLFVNVNEQNIYIKGYDVPGDGSEYSEGIKNLFPKDLHNRIFRFPESEIEELF
ncbi:hypothetical protein [Alteribacter aurantiacus]|uniref:hypothetical protein n=1 Tax=Alteribacter aurantiacus TaxID=254410 RepID=UPI0003F4FEDC|nr:hypothetical protein [Alteribacter aurantiacus]